MSWWCESWGRVTSPGYSIQEMQSRLIYISGIVLMLACIGWLALWSILPIGINDAERMHIHDTGFPSGGESNLIWGKWFDNISTNIGLMWTKEKVPMNSPIESYRIGIGETPFLTYSFYQAQCRLENGESIVVPAYGPDSGTHMKWHLPILGLGFSVGLILMGRKRNV